RHIGSAAYYARRHCDGRYWPARHGTADRSDNCGAAQSVQNAKHCRSGAVAKRQNNVQHKLDIFGKQDGVL
ncbi:hypothetical protein IW143_005711, partial [Coemansia sp. RSA 520]